MVVCEACRPRRAGCCMWTPMDTSIILIFFTFLAVLLTCVIMVIIPYNDTDHLRKTTCTVVKMEWTGLGYCTNCYTEDTGTSRKKRFVGKVEEVQSLSESASARSRLQPPTIALLIQKASSKDRIMFKMLKANSEVRSKSLNASHQHTSTVHVKSRKPRAVCYDDINPPSFPCVQVQVNYTSRDTNTLHSGVVHSTIEDVYKYPEVGDM